MARTQRSASAAPRRSRKSEAPAAPVEDVMDSAATIDLIHEMIAEAAYYRAESRGFQGGDPVEDWLMAEAEINARMQSVH